MDKKQMIVCLIAVAMLMYIGTTMFYSTGFGITDFNLEKSNSNDSQYELSYMLRSVRSFDIVDCEYSLISADGEVIGTGSTIMKDIKDGSFTINETINNTSGDSSKVPKEVQIRIYDEKFNPDLKNADGTSSQKVFFEQKFEVNN